MENAQLSIKHTPLIVAIGILSFVVHEFFHWLAGTLLGYDMFVSINKAGLASGSYAHGWHNQLVSAAGPAITIALAVASYALLQRHRSPLLFSVVFFSTLMRAMAAVVSIGTPNDEARISLWLGIGKFTLPLLVVAGLGWRRRRDA